MCKSTTCQNHSGRIVLPLCGTPPSIRCNLDGVPAAPDPQHPVSKAHACGAVDDWLIVAVGKLWRTLRTDRIRTNKDTAEGIRVGIVIIADVTEDSSADIDNLSDCNHSGCARPVGYGAHDN